MAQAFEGPEQQAHNERLQLEAKGNQKKSFAVENLAVFKYAQVIIKSNGDLFKEVLDTFFAAFLDVGHNLVIHPLPDTGYGGYKGGLDISHIFANVFHIGIGNRAAG